MHHERRCLAWARVPRLSPLVFCLVGAPALSRAQTIERVGESAASASWLAAQTPRCGEVIGRITRRVSPLAPDTLSTPLPGAFVAVTDSSSTNLATGQRGRWVAITDSVGLFRLRLPPNLITVLEVKAIGYEPALVALNGTRYRAAVVELVLGSNAFHALQRGISVLTTHGVSTCAP